MHVRLKAPDYIVARRFANKAWRRRHFRALGKNKQHRACMRAQKEAADKAQEVLRAAEDQEKALRVIRAARTKVAESRSSFVDKCKTLFKRLGRGR